MLTNILVLVVTIFLGAGLTFWLDGASVQENGSAVNVLSPDKSSQISREKIPSFEFKDLNGKKRKSHDFSDQIILINFWATWCAPCVIEFPKLIELAQKNPQIVIIALSSDIQDDQIKRFLQKNPAIPSNFIVARDQKRKITNDLFQTYKLPETLIVSPSGEIVRKIVGDTDWTGQEIQDLLNSLQ